MDNDKYIIITLMFILIIYISSENNKLKKEILASNQSGIEIVENNKQLSIRCEALAPYMPICLRLSDINDKFRSSRNAAIKDTVLQNMYKKLY